MVDSSLGPGAVEWLGTHYRTILETSATKGAMSITDTVGPPGSGPPRHVHRDADETFVLLAGDCEFWLNGETFFRSPGEAVFVPRGLEHTFRVAGHRPSRHLIILTPGGFEGFFGEMSGGGYSIPADMDAIAGIAARYHLEFTGPPLGNRG